MGSCLRKYVDDIHTGTEVTGDSDDLKVLLELRKKHNAWLHLEG
jgi:hypothetical protein